MKELFFSIADIEAEWERRGIQTNSKYRVVDEEGCRFLNPVDESWYRLNDEEYRGLLAVAGLRHYGISYQRQPDLWTFWTRGDATKHQGKIRRQAAEPIRLIGPFEKADAAVIAILKLTPFEVMAKHNPS